jgi:hypothetical protein
MTTMNPFRYAFLWTLFRFVFRLLCSEGEFGKHVGQMDWFNLFLRTIIITKAFVENITYASNSFHRMCLLLSRCQCRKSANR